MCVLTPEQLDEMGERHRKLLFAEWATLASVAWKGFQAWGKGLVVVQEESRQAHYWCWATGKVWAASCGVNLEESRDYDPEVEILALEA